MLSNYQSTEPLFIVIIREENADQKLAEWAKTVSKSRVEVDRDRAKLYDHRSLQHFYLNWAYDWERVIIWDCWNRFHVKL